MLVSWVAMLGSSSMSWTPPRESASLISVSSGVRRVPSAWPAHGGGGSGSGDSTGNLKRTRYGMCQWSDGESSDESES